MAIVTFDRMDVPENGKPGLVSPFLKCLTTCMAMTQLFIGFSLPVSNGTESFGFLTEVLSICMNKNS